MLRALLRTGLVVIAVAALGCAQDGSPTSPTRSAETSGSGSSQTQALFDSVLEGSAYRLTGVDNTTLSFSNGQDSYTLPWAGAKFRRAVLQSWSPGDPYYEAAVLYNAGDPFADTWTGVLKNLVGGNVRIVLLPPSPIFPGDPYHVLSFQPIP